MAAEAPTEAWDVTTDPANPQPLIWPVCIVKDKNGVECKTPWVWRWAMSWTGPSYWAWTKDCKHKKTEYKMMTKDGEYAPPE
jgi:hypothetical protein